KQLGGLVQAARACYDMAKVFGTPFISGKDSLNNEFNMGKRTVSIPPTLLISAIGIIDDVSKTVSSDTKEPGNLLYVLGETFQEMGGSHYFLVNKLSDGVVPRVDPAASKKIMKRLRDAIKKGLIRSAHDCSEGGIAVCLAEMLFSGGYGAEVSLKNAPRAKDVKRNDVLLFSESNSRFIVEIPEKKKKEFEKLMKGIPFGFLGRVSGNDKLTIKGLDGRCVINADINALKGYWKMPFERVMHEKS
ncbi:MAG: AIR synthase-related protein, partial [Candidatus Omnitrophota bacterium]